jgi:hypothetical protein
MVSPNKNWRNDTSLKSIPKYTKKFAWTPKTDFNGNKLWLKRYYRKDLIWSTNHFDEAGYYHVDFVENIDEAEYIVRKLAESL